MTFNTIRLFVLSIFFLFVNKNIKAQDNHRSFDIGVSGVPLFVSKDYLGFVVTPAFRLNLDDNLSLGTNLFFYGINDVSASGVSANSKAYGVVPSVRYGWNLNDRIRVFAETGAGFGSVIFKPNDVDNEFFPVERNNGGIFIFYAGPGAQYNLTDKINIQLMLPYLKVDNITNNDVRQGLFDGLASTLGINFRLQ